MPKKRTVAVKSKLVRRTTAKKAVQKAAPVKKAVRPATKTVTRPKAKAKRVSLGRPKVSGDEELDMLFRTDYHARQIFEFLRVRTVRELEQFTPEQIVDRLSAPIVETVQRIRNTLAGLNRALAGDERYAYQRKQTVPH